MPTPNPKPNNFRILTPEGTIRYTGTDGFSWFPTLEKAQAKAKPGDTILEIDPQTGRTLWEIL